MAKDVIDLTLSDSEEPDRSRSSSSKRKAQDLSESTSPIPAKKIKHEAVDPVRKLKVSKSQSSLSLRQPNEFKVGIPEVHVKIYAPQPELPTPPPPKNLYKNVLTHPQLHFTSETAKGFHVSDKIRPIVTLNEKELKRQFRQNLCHLNGPPVRLVNEIDGISPSVDFQFINYNVLGVGVERIPEEYKSGCQCRPDNGRQMGCEHLSCECVQLSDEDEGTGRKHFPYSASEKDYGCLRSVYLKTRRHIYECNDKCNCGQDCKNRVVQHGRRVPLEIFKTANRGFGK